jgi:hypothetical protein
MKNKNLLIAVVVAVVFGGAGFFGGMKYQQSKNPRFSNRALGPSGSPNFRGAQSGQNFRPVNGEIMSVDNKSITVKLSDGSSKIVLLSDSTAISKSESAAKEDLKVGEKISAFGSQNQDGSITANTIQLNPVFRGQNQ